MKTPNKNTKELQDKSLIGIFSKRYWSSIKIRILRAFIAAFPELRLRRHIGNSIAIHTQVSINQRLALYESARDNVRIGKMIEVGSYLGASAIVLAAAMRKIKQGTVYCIDTWQNDNMSEGKWDTYATFLDNTSNWSNIIPIRGRSDTVKLPFQDEVDLVFIDGLHSIKQLKEDFDGIKNRLSENAIVVCHDVKLCGLQPAIEAIEKENSLKGYYYKGVNYENSVGTYILEVK